MIQEIRDWRYTRWIERFKQENDVQGACLGATHSMNRKFPELAIVRGHVFVYDDIDETTYKYPHWWLITESGEIVDPTESQFPNIMEYQLWDETANPKEPTGKCPNCGGYCFDNRYLCSEKCDVEYIAYLNSC